LKFSIEHKFPKCEFYNFFYSIFYKLWLLFDHIVFYFKLAFVHNAEYRNFFIRVNIWSWANIARIRATCEMEKMSTAFINFWERYIYITGVSLSYILSWSLHSCSCASRQKHYNNVIMSANSEAGDHLDEIYDWIDQIKFSRPKRNIARDFSDGGNKKRHPTFQINSFILYRSKKLAYNINLAIFVILYTFLSIIEL